jgi:hypothetical protein
MVGEMHIETDSPCARIRKTKYKIGTDNVFVLIFLIDTE